jgi:hypothetical protein
MCILQTLLFSKETASGLSSVFTSVVDRQGSMTLVDMKRRGWMPDETCRV